jgi:glycosyltransferase involved in cell wall biosynthesis
MDKITIGICCYNSEDTVERAIESALAQDWPDFEVVIVDDGSGDNTVEVIRKKIQGHSRTRLICHEKNKRFPGALNTVIKNAQGTFIAIFDDDDESAPDRLAAQHKTITAYEQATGAELVACWGSGVRRYPNGYELKLQAIGSRGEPPVGMEAADFLLSCVKKPGVFYGNGTPSCSLMTRKSTYDAVGLYDERMIRSEDTDFAIRLARKGGHFIGCKEEVIIQYPSGGEEKKPRVNYESYKTLMEKHADYLHSVGRFEYSMLWNKLRLHHFSAERMRALGVLTELFIKYPRLTWTHFWNTAPRRLIHEWKMARRRKNNRQ